LFSNTFGLYIFLFHVTFVHRIDWH
jgi:hypothetical protein